MELDGKRITGGRAIFQNQRLLSLTLANALGTCWLAEPNQKQSFNAQPKSR